jgi:hypothetical protein
VKQLKPAGGICYESTATASGMADRPIARCIDPMLLPPCSDAELCGRCGGYPVPKPRLTLYFRGLLIKLEHLGEFRNWTLVLRNSPDSNCRDAKCYRIGAAAEGELQKPGCGGGTGVG